MATNFGREMSCTDSLKTGRYVTGPRLVAEACYRRLTTPRGMLRGGDDEAEYGLDLTALVGSVEVRRAEASLPGRIKAELSKDERIESLDVQVVATVEGGETTFAVTIWAETAEGPFSLQLGVSDVTTELLGIA